MEVVHSVYGCCSGKHKEHPTQKTRIGKRVIIPKGLGNLAKENCSNGDIHFEKRLLDRTKYNIKKGYHYIFNKLRYLNNTRLGSTTGDLEK